MQACNYLFIPSCSYRLWSWKYLDTLGYTPLTPSLVLQISGVWVSVIGVNDYLPSPSTPKIVGTSLLKAEIKMGFYLALCTLVAWNLSCWYSTFNAVLPVTNLNYLTMYINHWNCPCGIFYSVNSMYLLCDHNHIPPWTWPYHLLKMSLPGAPLTLIFQIFYLQRYYSWLLPLTGAYQNLQPIYMFIEDHYYQCGSSIRC